MPELDLTSAQAMSIGGKAALELRIADQTVWVASEQYIEHSVFENTVLTGYTVNDDLPATSWAAGNFYTTGLPFLDGWSIVGVRIWVPPEYSGPMLSETGFVSVKKVDDQYDDLRVGQDNAQDGQGMINDFETGGLKSAFTNLQAGWNDVYLDQPQPLKHGNGFAVGYQIGNGQYYVHKNVAPEAVAALDGTNLYFSEHDGANLAPKKSLFGTPSVSAGWSDAHYGVDVIIRESITPPNGEHSVWSQNWPEPGAVYTTGDDLIANSWTASNFYSYSVGGPQSGWTLVGARLWIPSSATDAFGLAGMTAECGYFIKGSGAIDWSDDPGTIISQIAASPTVSTTLVRGWNKVYFDTPVAVPWGAGISIGWKIGNGAYYSADQLTGNSIQSKDGTPFYLAASDGGPEERALYNVNGGSASWGFENAHYGSDIIVKEPPA